MCTEIQPTAPAPVTEPHAAAYAPHELGARGETAAVQSLTRRGWTLYERNWQSGYGEIDIVASDPAQPKTAVLIEVKTRSAPPDSQVMPELAVDAQRMDRYRRAALHYLKTHDWCESARCDVIAITATGEHEAHLRQYPSAFGGEP